MRARETVLLTLAAVVAAACADDATVDPAGPPVATAAGTADSARRDTTRGTRTDTTRRDTTRTSRPPVPPTDTSGRVVVTTADVSGRVIGAILNRRATGADTLAHVPLAGVTVKLFRNGTVNGASTSTFVSEVVTGAGGTFSFGSIPGGYYLLRSYPPAGSGYGESLSYLDATRAQVSMNIYVWQATSRTPPTGAVPPGDSTRRP
jgi:hypothetical protein